MGHRRIVKCPNCGNTAESTYTVFVETLYGSPYRSCRECGAAYFDPGYHEAAIDAYNDDGVEINFWWVIALLVLNGASVEYIIHGWITSIRELFSFMVLLVPALLLDYGLIQTIRNKLNAEEYHQEQIDLIEGRGGEMTEELAESMKRLGDRKYLDALRSHGVDVPEYLYKRLGSREGTFVEPEGVVEITMLNVKEIKHY